MGSEPFDTRTALLDRLGVEWRQCRVYDPDTRASRDVPFLKEVRLPFTPEEWCSTCMREGDDYWGGCCGTSSAMQDVMNAAFRDGGWLEVDDLLQLAEMGEAHGTMESDVFQFGEMSLGLEDAVAAAERARPSTWEFAALLSHLVRGLEAPDGFTERQVKERRGELHEAVHVLSNTMRDLDWDRMWSSTDSDAAGRDQADARLTLGWARAAPAIRTVHAALASGVGAPFEGFAVVDAARPAEVATNRRGPCVYRSREDARHVIDQDRAYAATGPDHPSPTTFVVRPVRVSVENGIEFTGEVGP